MSKAKIEISTLKALGEFFKGRACSDMLFHLVNRAFEHPMEPEERAAMPLAGGIMQNGYQCGMIWGSALAAGAQAYRLFGPGPQAETGALVAAQKLVESFTSCSNNINCLEITDLDKSSTTMQQIMFFVIKGGTIGCSRMAAKYAPLACEEINIALSEESIEAPCSPVSCAAMLAKKMGASEAHQAMAAGLAGGIGLCGGACGALGAAVWITAMKAAAEQGGKVDYKDPRTAKVVDKFLKCTNYKFECSEIVGRKFANIEDHAAYLRDGGCAKIIDALSEEMA